MSIKSIRQRLAAATPGPWQAFVPAEEDGYVEWWVWQTAALPFYGGVFHVQGHEGDTRHGEIGSAVITDGDDLERERKDAEFIAASRTDVELLLDVAKAVKVLLPEAEYAGNGAAYVQIDALKALAEALDALEAAP